MARSAVPYLRWKERDRVNTTPAITNIQQQASKELTIAEHAAAMRSGLDGSGDERLKLFLFFWWTYPTYPVNFCCWLIQLKQRPVDEFPLFL